jgi:hypothetical protein
MSAWVDFGATLNDQTDGLISLASTFLVISVAIGTGAGIDTAIKTPGFSRLVKRAASPFRLPKVVSKDAARGAGRLDRSWKAELRQRHEKRGPELQALTAAEGERLQVCSPPVPRFLAPLHIICHLYPLCGLCLLQGQDTA